MDTALLYEWLDLPPCPWPPEPRVMLGLPPGPANARQAEEAALARMNLLRPHQLRHPDLVTEGMNRLAQALVAVTAEPPAKVEVAPPVLAKPKRRKRPQTKVREVYQELAANREIRRHWEQAGPFFGVGTIRLDEMEVVCRILSAGHCLRRKLSGSLAHSDAGAIVLSKTPHSDVQALTPDERDRLPDDWHSGRQKLIEDYRRARERAALRRHSRPFFPLIRWWRKTPESWFALAAMLALAIFSARPPIPAP